MGEDNWKHRGQKMRCGTCMWFVVKPNPSKSMDIDETDVMVLGRCRKHAPTLNGWPAIFNEDWCGDHKLDETKL